MRQGYIDSQGNKYILTGVKAQFPRWTYAEWQAEGEPDIPWIRTDAPSGYRKVSGDDVSYDNTISGLTATDTQGAIDEVNEKVGEWSQPELLYSETWGGLYGSYNEKCKLAVLRWYGNSTSATAGIKDYSLPAHYKPAFAMFSMMYHSTSMEINPQTEKINIAFTENNWVSGSMIYPTK